MCVRVCVGSSFFRRLSLYRSKQLKHPQRAMDSPNRFFVNVEILLHASKNRFFFLFFCFCFFLFFAYNPESCSFTIIGVLNDNFNSLVLKLP